MLGDNFHTVTILHTDADNEWCEYVAKKFKSDKLNVKIKTLEVTSVYSDDRNDIKNSIAESFTVVLLTTDSFLNYMEMNDWLALLLENRDISITTIVAALLNVSADDLEKVSDKYNYNRDHKWTILEIDVLGTNIQQIITEILGIADRNAETLEKRIPVRTNSDPAKLSISETRETFEVIPSTIYQEGEKVALIFHKEKVKGSVTVHSGSINIPVETINPYCVTFKAPAISGKKISLQVDINNNKLRRFKLLNGIRTPQFSSVELMCQSYGVENKDDLDKALANKFTSSLCADSCAMMIFDEIETKSPRECRRNSQYPTLLHWAAANGLRELCSALLSAPGANEACSIFNCDDDDVADLADNNGYVDLADFITEFKDTKDMADACDLYVQANGDCGYLYEIMTPISGKPVGPPVVPRTPPSGKSFTLPPRLSPHIEEDDNLYITPANRLPTPQEFISANIGPKLPKAAIGSRSQAELIEIQKEVKNGNFSIKEAEMLFKAWKARYETGNAISFKERQQSLQAMREENKRAMDVLKAAKHTEQDKGKKNKKGIGDLMISEPIGMRQKNLAKQLAQFQGPGRGDSGTGSDRADSGRYSGRDSTLSCNSTSSEEAELEQDKPLVRTSRSQSEKAAARLTSNRQTLREQYIELIHDPSDVKESGPPPLPPPRVKPAAKPPPQVAVKPVFAQLPKLPTPAKKPTVFKK